MRATSAVLALSLASIPLGHAGADEGMRCVLTGARSATTSARGEINTPKAKDTFNIEGKGEGLVVTSAFWPKKGDALATGVEYTATNSVGAVAVQAKALQWQADGGLFTAGTTYRFTLHSLGAPQGNYGTRSAHGTLQASLRSVPTRAAKSELTIECTF